MSDNSNLSKAFNEAKKALKQDIFDDFSTMSMPYYTSTPLEVGSMSKYLPTDDDTQLTKSKLASSPEWAKLHDIALNEVLPKTIEKLKDHPLVKAFSRYGSSLIEGCNPSDYDILVLVDKESYGLFLAGFAESGSDNYTLDGKKFATYRDTRTELVNLVLVKSELQYKSMLQAQSICEKNEVTDKTHRIKIFDECYNVALMDEFIE